MLGLGLEAFVENIFAMNNLISFNALKSFFWWQTDPNIFAQQHAPITNLHIAH
jgi:hypothetical protein